MIVDYLSTLMYQSRWGAVSSSSETNSVVAKDNTIEQTNAATGSTVSEWPALGPRKNRCQGPIFCHIPCRLGMFCVLSLLRLSL